MVSRKQLPQVPGRVLSSRVTYLLCQVPQWLNDNDLAKYSRAFRDLGFGSLQDIQRLTEDATDALLQKLKMKEGDRVKFWNATHGSGPSCMHRLAGRANELFGEIDTDGNGKLSRAEVHEYLVNNGVSKDTADRLFDRIDGGGIGLTALAHARLDKPTPEAQVSAAGPHVGMITKMEFSHGWQLLESELATANRVGIFRLRLRPLRSRPLRRVVCRHQPRQ